MTCSDFTHQLPDYLDASLGEREHAAVRAHAAECVHCQRALQRAQHTAGALHGALAHAVSDLSVSPAFAQRILRAAAAETTPTPPDLRAWLWLTGHPLRTMGATALAALLLLAFQLRDPESSRARSAASTPIAFTIDVPFESDPRAGLMHAEYILFSRNSSSP